MCIGRLSEIRLFSIYSNSTHLVVFEDLLWQAKTPVFMAGVFACLYVIRIGGAAVLFLGGQVISSFVTSYRLRLRLRYGRVVFPARHAGLSAVNHTQKRAPCLGRRYEKMLLTHSFLFRCVSQPPPLRGTSFHRKEGEPCPCIAFPYCHFERKREIFFVCGQ